MRIVERSVAEGLLVAAGGNIPLVFLDLQLIKMV